MEACNDSSTLVALLSRAADMQREQRIREITLLQNRITHATKEIETNNQLEMERVAVELELRRKCVNPAGSRNFG